MTGDLIAPSRFHTISRLVLALLFIVGAIGAVATGCNRSDESPSAIGFPSNLTGVIPFTGSSTFLTPTSSVTITLADGREVLAAPGEVLITVREDITPAELAEITASITSLGGSVLGSRSDTRTIQVSVPPMMGPDSFLTMLTASSSAIVSGGLNILLSISKTNEEGYQRWQDRVASGEITLETTPSGSTSSLPPVPVFPGSDWIQQIKADKAWPITTGSSNAGATIGIVDTGVRADQTIIAETRLRRLSGNGNVITDDDTKALIDHGRGVAAFAAGFRDSNAPARGLAWNNAVLSVDVARPSMCGDGAAAGTLGCESSIFITDLQQGIITAIDGGARIINLSFGPKQKCSDSSVTKQANLRNFRAGIASAIDLAKRRDCLVVLASGNECEKSDNQLLTDTTQVTTSWQTNALIVGATDGVTGEATFSNMGSVVNIMAPGNHVAFEQGEDRSGTSFAAPMVTGASALVAAVNQSLLAPEVRRILLTSADQSSAIVHSPRLFLNAERAVTTAKGLLTVPLESLPTTTLGIGETAVTTVSITLPASTVPTLDVMFLIDTTGSYGDDIATLQSQAQQIIDNISSRGIDVQFGVASFADVPIFPFGSDSCGDKAFYLNQPITTNISLVRAGINSLDKPLHCGADEPEAQLEALFQVATGAGKDRNGDGDFADIGELPPTTIGWRTGSLKIVVLATDASFHDHAVDPSYPGPTFTETLDALKRAGIIVIGLDSGNTAGDLRRVVDATGGSLFQLSSNSADIANKIATGVTDVLRQVTLTLDRVSEGRWIKNISPESFANVRPGETRNFTVTLEGQMRSGLLRQNYDVLVWALANSSATVKRIRLPIRVPTVLGF